MRESFLSSLRFRIKALEMALSTLERGGEQARVSIARVAQQLRGSGVDFGFPEIAARAQDVIEAADEDVAVEARDLVHHLRDVAAAMTDDSPVTDPSDDVLIVEPKPQSEPEEQPRPIAIVHVDSDDLVATLVADRLGRDGFELSRFSDGESALAQALINPPDLVILDVKIPKMDGFELLSLLRSTPRTAEVPVIVLSAMGSERDVVRGFDLGANDYVLKPFSPTELSARVQRLVPTS